MSAGKQLPVPVESADLEDVFRVDCYVRAAVPAAVDDILTDVFDRLEGLRADGTIDEFRIVRWPPAGPDDGSESAREGLVDAFERWAERQGHSLEPAFRHRTIPPSPLCPGSDARERIRVPLVSLALYEVTDEDDPAEVTTLRGVVPHTDRTDAATERTYTVEEWLSAAEHAEPAVDTSSDGAARGEQVPLSEGGR